MGIERLAMQAYSGGEFLAFWPGAKTQKDRCTLIAPINRACGACLGHGHLHEQRQLRL